MNLRFVLVDEDLQSWRQMLSRRHNAVEEVFLRGIFAWAVQNNTQEEAVLVKHLRSSRSSITMQNMWCTHWFERLFIVLRTKDKRWLLAKQQCILCLNLLAKERVCGWHKELIISWHDGKSTPSAWTKLKSNLTRSCPSARERPSTSEKFFRSSDISNEFPPYSTMT